LQIFLGFGVIEEMNLYRCARGEISRDGIFYGAPHFRRRNDLYAGKFAKAGNFWRDVAQNTAAAEHGIIFGRRFDLDALNSH
jgi:hypothetical protein